MSDIVGSMNHINHEMIFVNDDSNDNSVEILKTFQDQHPITIINMSRRFGVTPCVLAGFAHAQGDAVIYMDSDLQDPPEIIPEMVEKFLSGAEVVHTSRSHRDGENFLKMWITQNAYKMINRFSQIDLPENTGDFKLLSRRAVREVLSLTEYDPYMRGLSVWIGHRQDFVYYRREPRWKGRTKFPVFSRGPIGEFIRGLTAYSAAPLYLSLILGLITCAFSVIAIIYALVTKILGVSAPGTSSVLIAVAFFCGIILVTNGVTGIYLARIYYETKKRPRYIIESIDPPPKDSFRPGQSTRSF